MSASAGTNWTKKNAENESESEFTTVENSAPSDNTYGSIGINFNIPISKIHHENKKKAKIILGYVET